MSSTWFAGVCAALTTCADANSRRVVCPAGVSGCIRARSGVGIVRPCVRSGAVSTCVICAAVACRAGIRAYAGLIRADVIGIVRIRPRVGFRIVPAVVCRTRGRRTILSCIDAIVVGLLGRSRSLLRVVVVGLRFLKRRLRGLAFRCGRIQPGLRTVPSRQSVSRGGHGVLIGGCAYSSLIQGAPGFGFLVLRIVESLQQLRFVAVTGTRCPGGGTPRGICYVRVPHGLVACLWVGGVICTVCCAIGRTTVSAGALPTIRAGIVRASVRAASRVVGIRWGLVRGAGSFSRRTCGRGHTRGYVLKHVWLRWIVRLLNVDACLPARNHVGGASVGIRNLPEVRTPPHP